MRWSSLSLSLEFLVGKVGSVTWCSTSFNCCVVVVWFTVMNCDSALTNSKLPTSLQACNPSNHVWSVLELSLVPQLLNQAPPGAQQLSLPDFLVAAHLEHTEAILTAVTAGVDMQALVKLSKCKTTSTLGHVSYICRERKKTQVWHYACRVTSPLQACKPLAHVCSTEPPFPQSLNQAPPGAQQLGLPDFSMVPHLKHTETSAFTVVAAAANGGMWVLGQKKETDRHNTWLR